MSKKVKKKQKKALKAMKTIHKYCSSHETCHSCVFYRKNDEWMGELCFLIKAGNPMFWKKERKS